MCSTQVWEGLDRQAFFENAILLEVKHPSQGQPVKTPARNVACWMPASQDEDAISRWVPGFLDDFALAVSGPGGPENVSAVCIEIEPTQQVVALRVARNAGFSEDVLCHLQSITRIMTRIAIKSRPISLLSFQHSLYLSLLAAFTD